MIYYIFCEISFKVNNLNNLHSLEGSKVGIHFSLVEIEHSLILPLETFDTGIRVAVWIFAFKKKLWGEGAEEIESMHIKVYSEMNHNAFICLSAHA